METKRNECRQLANDIENLDDQNIEVQKNGIQTHNEYLKEKMKTNNLFLKTKQFQDGTKLVEDFSNNKFIPKSAETMDSELEEIKKENEVIFESLRNFKGTHPEFSVAIDEVMNI